MNSRFQLQLHGNSDEQHSREIGASSIFQSMQRVLGRTGWVITEVITETSVKPDYVPVWCLSHITAMLLGDRGSGGLLNTEALQSELARAYCVRCGAPPQVFDDQWRPWLRPIFMKVSNALDHYLYRTVGDDPVGEVQLLRDIDEALTVRYR